MDKWTNGYVDIWLFGYLSRRSEYFAILLPASKNKQYSNSKACFALIIAMNRLELHVKMKK